MIVRFMQITYYIKRVSIPYLLVIRLILSRSISSLVGLFGVLSSSGTAFVTFLLGCFRFLK